MILKFNEDEVRNWYNLHVRKHVEMVWMAGFLCTVSECVRDIQAASHCKF